jgi:hypothetical protein
MAEQMRRPEWRDEVLEKLDAAAELNMFPGQPNEYFALADMRMTAFRSDEEWLLVFEVVGWAKREFAFENQLTAFGNRLDQPKFTAVEVVTKPGSDNPWADDGAFELDTSDLQFAVRGKSQSLKPTAADWRAAGVEDESMPQPARVIRLLADQFSRELFLSNDELLEAAGRSGSDLTPFLQEQHWRQPDIYEDERPSDVVCFQSLATALAEGDPSCYECSKSEWNTHWSNWED